MFKIFLKTTEFLICFKEIVEQQTQKKYLKNIELKFNQLFLYIQPSHALSL